MKRLLLVAAVVLSIGVAPSLAGDARSTVAPSNVSPPTVSGTAQIGQALTASSGSWAGDNPITFTYAWERCDTAGSNCAAIAGATASVYSVVAADGGHTLRIAVTAHNSSGTATAESTQTATVTAAAAPQNTAEPQITGTATVGSTLTATNGTWSGSTPITYTYAWERCATNGASCAAISGATSQTYVAASADAAHTLRVVVTATNAAGSAQATSAFVSVNSTSAPVNTVAPAVSGTAKQGQTLSTTIGTWTGGSLTYAYLWYRCDAGETNCVSIAGATAATYVVTATDVGHYVISIVVASNNTGSARANSNAIGPMTASVAPPPPPPSGTTKLPNGETSIQASSVPDTDRLTVSSVKFNPSVITGRAPVTVTFKIIENNKYDVSGALVYVLGLPYSWAKASPEGATAADGTVTLTITPTAKAPKRGSLVLFVRARTPSGSLLAGSSTRRLVQVLMRP
jgi:large repetitive protein